MVLALQYLYIIRSSAKDEARGFGAGFAASVYSHEEIMVAGFHRQREFHLVAERDGTCVQAVGGYGRNAECTGLGHDDGASYAQGITGGTRGRVDDEAVSLISGQKFAIHFHPDGNHGGIVPFQDSHFVQGIWVSGEFRTFVFHFDDATFINFVCVVVDVVDAFVDFFRRHIG